MQALPLVVADAAFGYKTGQPIFTGITFDVRPGEVFCIVGPNGCGKSTLIDSVLGENKISAGSIRLGGKELRTLKPREFAQAVAYVPQSHTKSFPYTVLDVVLMGRTYAARVFAAPDEEQIVRARDALRRVHMDAFENRLYTELSGGELQLVMIARALAQSAKLLVMDEPTAHLDFRHELGVMELLTELVGEGALSILMATHFLNQALYLENAGVPTRVALMTGGNFKLIGCPSEVLDEKNLKEVFGIVTCVAETLAEGKERKYIMALRNVHP